MEAAVDRNVALEWVAFLETVAKATGEMIAEKESRGAEGLEGWIISQKTLVDFVRTARLHALEHVASFGDSSVKTAAS